MKYYLNVREVRTSIKKSIIANYSGQIWISLLGIIVVPIYIKYLGIKTYGLIGVLMTLSALIAYLDFGLSKAANREIAKRSNSAELVTECHDIIRTLEIIYLGIGIFISLILFFLSDFISANWLNSDGLPNDIIQFSIILHGITLGVRWPIALYTEVLRGLEKQILLNILVTSVATVNRIGSVIIVIFISSSIIAYLVWMLVTGVVELIILYYFAWLNIPKKKTVNLFSSHLMKDIWKFSTTLTFTSVFATILKQLDKIVISKVLPLEQMGYYVTATTVTNNLIKLVNPTIASVFPRMSSLIFQKNFKLLSELYHKSTQTILIIIAPLACILVFFSYEILLLWTQSEAVALNTHTVLTILSVAVLFNTALQTHYILQFAGGLTWIPLVCNFISSIIMVPTIYYSILEFGISGAGFSWLVLNAIYFFIIPKITHSYILKHDYYKWIVNDTLYFIFLSILIFSISYIIKSYYGIHGITIIFLIFFSLIIYILSIFYFKPLIFYDIKYSINLFLNKSS